MTARPLRRRALCALLALPLAFAACSSGSGGGSSGSTTSSTSSSPGALKSANTALLGQLQTYLSTVSGCKSKSSPVVCVEAADRQLGGEVHDYANTLASGTGFGVKTADLTAARNAAQLLANSMEILGDAQPTQSNYDQVLNTFNVNSSIASVRSAVTKLQSDLG